LFNHSSNVFFESTSILDVQPNRDPLKNRENPKRQNVCNPISTPTSPLELCLSNIFKTHCFCAAVTDNEEKCSAFSAVTAISRNIKMLGGVSTSTPTEVIIALIEAASLLLRPFKTVLCRNFVAYYIGYAKYCQARIDAEVLELYGKVRDVPRNIYGYPTELVFITFGKWLRIWRITRHQLAAFLRDTFQCYRELPTDQKWILFRHFFETFCGIEAHVLTNMHFPNPSSTCVATTLCTYVDLSCIDRYFTAEQNRVFARVVTNVISRRIDVVRNLRDFTVDRFELAALVGLTLFSQAIDGLTEETKSVVHKMQEKILVGLHYYYTETLKVKNYAYRLGESISLLWLVQKCCYKFKNTSETAALFGIYNSRELFFNDFGPQSL
uniref:NR LBD domain-containing protein n=1 Tax=Enterobius vermicularis TaxID=51028 RepID=A0A0N4VAN7_ENTVE